MSENSFAPIGEDNAQVDAQMSETYLTPDEFGSLVGVERQTVSYHLRKGLLSRYVDDGTIKVEPYQIPAALVEWFLSQKGISSRAKASKVSAPLPQVYAPTPAQVPQVSPQVPAQMDAQMSESFALMLEQIKESHKAALDAKDETLEELRERIKKLEEDKAIMTRQIEAGNNAMVTMREAKKMQEEARKNPAWMFWRKSE